MSSERYDEAVREQKKAERKKQVQKQVMILVIALVVIAVAAAAVFFTIKGKKSEPKDTTKASSSGLAGAISASYETFASEADPDASAEEKDEEINEMLKEGNQANFVRFEGLDHMTSFNYAYDLSAVRDWLFAQSK